MSSSFPMREILRQRFPELLGEVLVWLQTTSGPQLAEIIDIMGIADLHLFVRADPEGRMWSGVAPPAMRSDAKDAERYRFLRNSPHFNSDKDRLEWYLPRWHTDRGTIAERLDRSIDQSMKETPG